MVLGGVEGLFADVVSRPALELLAGAGIAVEYTVVVPGIMNRRDGHLPCGTALSGGDGRRVPAVDRRVHAENEGTTWIG